MLSAAEKGREFDAETIILEQLRFADIDRRLRELDRRPAHERSYLWLKEGDPHEASLGRTPSIFESWLSSQDRLYWITGKPGSGKSTLMKHLYQRPETRGLLEVWAQDCPLLITAYFFWELGKVDLLQTQEGLLRTLIFQSLQQRPDMIREIYPDLYGIYNRKVTGNCDDHWSYTGLYVPKIIEDLVTRLQTICSLLSKDSTRLCFFIDGLDEYRGHPDDIVQLVQVFMNIPNVKICVASRPENAFLDVFGKSGNKLYMQDFNRQDIASYIHDTLESNVNYQDLEDKDTLGVELIKEMVNNAEGVLLWVFLVLQAFKEGLRKRDKIADLHKRLRTVPSDLEEFLSIC